MSNEMKRVQEILEQVRIASDVHNKALGDVCEKFDPHNVESIVDLQFSLREALASLDEQTANLRGLTQAVEAEVSKHVA